MLSDKQGKLVPFLRDQLFVDILASCKHRSSAIEDSTAITQIVINDTVKSASSGTVYRQDLVKTSAKVLGRVDKAAATIYLAYHPLSN
jgi:hypothetical protein